MPDHDERAKDSGLPPLGDGAEARTGGAGAGLPPLDTPPRTPASEQPTVAQERPAAAAPQQASGQAGGAGRSSVDWRSGKVAVAAAAVLATAGLAAGMWIGDANADPSAATGTGTPPGMGTQGTQDLQGGTGVAPQTGTQTPQWELDEDDLQQADPSGGGWGMPGDSAPQSGSGVPETGSGGGWGMPDSSSGVPQAPGVMPGGGMPDGSSGAS